jgi:TPR repeat protein
MRLNIPRCYPKRALAWLIVGLLLLPASGAAAAQLKERATAEDMQAMQEGMAQGRASDQNNLGLAFETGRGVQRDATAAAQAYRQAADAGSANGAYNLGRLYEFGVGLPQDYREAAQWYRRAADKGMVLAEARLGWLYDYGLGVGHDTDQAEQWFRKAADQGYVEANARLLSGPPHARRMIEGGQVQIVILGMTLFCLAGFVSLAKLLMQAFRTQKIRIPMAAAEIESARMPEAFAKELRHHLFIAAMLFIGAACGLGELALACLHR